MTFHMSVQNTILFSFWQTNNTGEYLGACLIIFAAGMASVFLRLYRGRLETWWELTGGGPRPVAMKHCVRAGLAALSFSLDYGLMLIAMLFEVGLFFAVVGGLVMGVALFTDALREPPSSKGKKEQGGALGTGCCD
mmetsp:Transcript_10515/g.30298  ORF Transcript_10515/g.30298 Transcript_10515/m.30298 type:complete len:136 (-) Transcript_10515:7-414(-)